MKSRRAQTYTNVRAYDMYYVHVSKGKIEWAIYMHWYVPPVLWERESGLPLWNIVYT